MSQSRKKQFLEQDICHQKYFFNKSWDILILNLLKNPNRLSQAETLCQRAQNLGYQSADLFDLEVHLLEYYIETSKKLFLESLDIMNEFFDGEDNICDQASIHVGLGKIYQTQGETQKAIEAYHIALKIYDKIYICQESDAISWLYTYTQLAFFQAHLHHKFQARQYFKKHQENFGNQHFRSLDIAKFFEKMKIPL